MGELGHRLGRKTRGDLGYGRRSEETGWKEGAGGLDSRHPCSGLGRR